MSRVCWHMELKPGAQVYRFIKIKSNHLFLPAIKINNNYMANDKWHMKEKGSSQKVKDLYDSLSGMLNSFWPWPWYIMRLQCRYHYIKIIHDDIKNTCCTSIVTWKIWSDHTEFIEFSRGAILAAKLIEVILPISETFTGGNSNVVRHCLRAYAAWFCDETSVVWNVTESIFCEFCKCWKFIPFQTQSRR